MTGPAPPQPNILALDTSAQIYLELEPRDLTPRWSDLLTPR